MVKYVTDFFIYRWRYALGYSITGLILTELLILAVLYIPGGVSASEMAAAVTSSNLSPTAFDPASIINLPYYLLQHLSFSVLGITQFSVKLPSIIFGSLSIVGMIMLLRTWFRENVAILTTILVVTTGQFLFIAQSGTPNILYVFWAVWILVAAMMISRGAPLSWAWKIVLFGLAALSLYTPLSLYMLLALASATALHPHLRYIMRRLPKARLLLAAFFALILLAPLIRALITDPSLVYTLLGIPQTMPNFLESAGKLLSQYFDFASPTNSFFMTPVFSLPAMLLIILGVYRLITTKYTARSYIIVSWIILLIPTLLMNPMFVSVTFIPAMLLMGMGVDVLFRRWYRLFPRNPYARIAGLIPLSALMAIMVFSGVERYAYGYHYGIQTAGSFSKDLRLLDTIIAAHKNQPVTIVTTDNEAAFYHAVANYQQHLSVTSANAQLPANSTLVVTHDAQQAGGYGIPTRIITNSLSHDADRFYVYNSGQK